MVEKHCEVCDKVFESRPCDNRKYCSKACYLDSKSPLENRQCPQCNNIFSVRSNSVKKFCSDTCWETARRSGYLPTKQSIVHCYICNAEMSLPRCRAGNQYQKKYFCGDKCRNTPCFPAECKSCHKPFLVTYHNAHGAKYCSTECKNAEIRKKWANGYRSVQVEAICKKCQKPFMLRRTLVSKQEYCSQKCSGVAVGEMHTGAKSPVWKPKIKLCCANCGNDFETYPSRSERRKYCSRKCLTAGNLKRFAANERTDIEIAMAKALSEHKVKYSEQVVMFDKFMVDFLLPEHNIIVQCDGMYWHDRPKAKQRDKGQDRYFAKAGYTVLRFTDKQINKHMSECIATIRRAIKSPNQLPLMAYV